jgi:hypothetical protein
MHLKQVAHEALKVLYQKEFNVIGEGPISNTLQTPIFRKRYGTNKVTIEDIRLGIVGKSVTYRELMEAIEILESQRHITVSDDDSPPIIRLTQEGGIAFMGEYYLRQRAKDRNDSYYDVVKWVFPILSFFIALATIIIASNRNSEIKDLQIRVTQIEALRKH